MQKKRDMQEIEITLHYGEKLTQDQVLALLEGERRKVIAVVEAMRHEYEAIPPGFLAQIEAERLMKSYRLN